AEAATKQPEVEPEAQQEDAPGENRGDPARRTFRRQQDDDAREQGQEDNSGQHSAFSPSLSLLQRANREEDNHQYHDDATKHGRAVVLHQPSLGPLGDTRQPAYGAADAVDQPIDDVLIE